MATAELNVTRTDDEFAEQYDAISRPLIKARILEAIEAIRTTLLDQADDILTHVLETEITPDGTAIAYEINRHIVEDLLNQMSNSDLPEGFAY